MVPQQLELVPALAESLVHWVYNMKSISVFCFYNANKVIKKKYIALQRHICRH